MKKPKYITTSIAYVNAEPHIGFLFELLAADVIKRSYLQSGEGAYLVTGTDEHGTKVAQAAKAAGLEPQAYVDGMANRFKQLKEFGVDYDYFIQTTNPDHQRFVQAQWQKLVEKGVLQKKAYVGLYCSGCEAFKTDAEIVNGKCVIHERELEKIEEENWFLLLDEPVKAELSTFINERVFPETRRQEVLNVLQSGAYDEISVSRSRDKLSWGVPVPNDETQTMYVWVDALFNYISALAITGKDNLWPADVQIVGKDILKFHAIIWPALLLATGYELPKKLLVHGFINSDGKKMSKSLGNVITPAELKDRYGVEATRYLLFRQLSFYDDSNFVWSEFDALYNGELANGIGNLTARIIGIATRANCQYVVSENSDSTGSLGTELANFAHVLETANQLVKDCDATITGSKLWENPADKQPQIQEVLHTVDRIARILEPFMPATAAEIRRQLTELDSKPLFPRLQA